MTSSLLVWLRRARPSRASVLKAAALSLLAAVTSIVLLGGSGLLIGKAAGGGGLAALGVLLVVIELVAFLRAPLRYQERIITHSVALGSMVRWRTWLYDTVAGRLPGGLSSASSGDLLDRAIEDVDALEDLWVRLALPVLSALVTGLLGVVVVLIFDPAAGGVLAAGFLLGCLTAVLVARGAESEAVDEARWRGETTAKTVDLVVGLAELTMANGATDALSQIERAEQRRRALVSRSGARRGVGFGLVGLWSGLAVLGVVLLAAEAVHAGSLTSAAAAGLTLVAVASIEPLLNMVVAALRAPEVAASADRLSALEAIPLAVHEPEHPVPWPPRSSIVLAGLDVAPAPGFPAVLHGASLEIRPGERIAILGASGSGKSTLCALLLRFIAPQAGRLSLGAVLWEDLDTAELRQRIALLDQSPVLFGGTIADTLRLGDPAATDEQLSAMLELVDLSELGDHALSLDLAEDGASLSGGQQRRLALARVLLRRPEILLLDEPTAGLSESQGVDVLRRALALTPEATVVLCTHRVAEAEGFDRVFVLDQGAFHQLGDAARAAFLTQSTATFEP